MRRAGLPTIVLAAAMAAAVAGPSAALAWTRQAAGKIDPDAAAIADFRKRVDAYAELHAKLEATLPQQPEHPTPQQVDTHQRALGRLLVQARPRAQHGDMFAPNTRAFFRRQIARALAGPDGREIKDEIMDDNPGRIQLRINGRYPDGIPVSTMPAQILAVLPPLPDELEYRFIGRRLILLDVHAHLVVDYIDDAVPR